MNPQLRKQTNAQFVVRLYDDTGVKLVGAGQLHKHIGLDWSEKLANKAFERLSKCNTNKHPFAYEEVLGLNFI